MIPKSPFNVAKRNANYNTRYYFIIFILILATLGLLYRLVDLTVLNRAFLQGQGDARTLRNVAIPAYRGVILDRNGESLAISTPVDSVWVNPDEFEINSTELTKFAALLNIPKASIQQRIKKSADRDFVYLKRGLDPDLGAQIKALAIPGVYLQREYRRYYPEGEVMAHVLGFTNIDDSGQEGLELACNSWLQGAPGLKRVLQDRLGHVVADIGILRVPRPGQNITLSIDRRLQYFAYHELEQGVAKFKATSGSAVVLDVATGEILAMVNWPSFNPNNRATGQDERFRNRAVTDTFEPGSTIKTFGITSALLSGKYQVNSKVNTSPGWIVVSGKKLEDEHKHGVLDLTGILKYSSDVGMTKVTLSLPPSNLWNVLHTVGFGELTDSNFPGERLGSLPNYPTWNPLVLATLSFGYGMTVTTLQLAQAYAILARGGVKLPVTFLKRDDRPQQSQQVLDPQISQAILTMLESVLTQGGTAPLAKVPGYRVTGKTGTAKIVGPHGYEKHRYNSIFVGIAPLGKPRLVIAVVLHDPRGVLYYGGDTSGPIFSHIMGEALRLLNIPPDDLNSKTTLQTAAVHPEGVAD